MLCPKCGYNSFDYLTSCPKCRKDWNPVRRQLFLTGPQPVEVNFFSSLGGGRHSVADQGQGSFLDSLDGSASDGGEGDYLEAELASAEPEPAPRAPLDFPPPPPFAPPPPPRPPDPNRTVEAPPVARPPDPVSTFKEPLAPPPPPPPPPPPTPAPGGSVTPVEVDIFADEGSKASATEVTDVFVEPSVEEAPAVSVEPEITPVEDFEPVETLEAVEAIEPMETLEAVEAIEPMETVEAVESIEPADLDFASIEPELTPVVAPEIIPEEPVFAPEPELAAMPDLAPEPPLATNLLSPAPPAPPVAPPPPPAPPKAPAPPPPPPRTAAPKRPGSIAGAPSAGQPTKPQMVKMEAPEPNPIKQIRDTLVTTGDLPRTQDPTETFMVPPSNLEVLTEDDDTHTLAAPEPSLDSLDDDFDLAEDGGSFDPDLSDDMDLDGLDDLDDDE